LDAAMNRRLTEIGPGTPMGAVLRRHWHPVAAVADFPADRIAPIRLFGEDLVLYRDRSGGFGLLDRHCPHRRADLAIGFTEANGIRCAYHGWQYGADGACLAQPYEDAALPQSNFRRRIRTTAYPVRVHAGLLWAYLGPDPAPELPDWEAFSWPNGFVQIVFAEVPCNWLQCQENSIDPVHFEWAHMNWTRRLQGKPEYGPRHLKVDFEEFEFGFVYRRVREDTSEEDALWKVGRVCLWPNGFYLGDHFEWRVPIDDTRTLSVTWAFTRVPLEAEPFAQQRIPAWNGPLKHPDGRWIDSHVMNQDFAAWCGQGVIADRTKEHLAASDRGIAMLRRRLLKDIEAVERGEDPKAVLRDASRNRALRLPVAHREAYLHGRPLAELRRDPIYGRMLDGYVFQAGQPEEVRREFRTAMGIDT
jgi:5,5'-dehydrodivanillate O-demethylase